VDPCLIEGINQGLYPPQSADGFRPDADLAVMPHAVIFLIPSQSNLDLVELQNLCDEIQAILDASVTAPYGINDIHLDVAGDRIALSADPSYIQALVLMLSPLAKVGYIEAMFAFETNNNKASPGIQSSGGTTTPIWDRGITGAGTIVGIADTGIDTDSCFFADPATAVPYCETQSSTGVIRDPSECVISTTHRKMATYRYFTGSSISSYNSDQKDTSSGHGTHTSGSIA